MIASTGVDGTQHLIDTKLLHVATGQWLQLDILQQESWPRGIHLSFLFLFYD